MKVKDKLSKEYAKLQCTQGISELTRLCEIDFRAGFETAREMCAELFKNSLDNPKYKHQLFDVAVKMISEDLLSVGEEEAL